jgi:hypothetical protein
MMPLAHTVATAPTGTAASQPAERPSEASSAHTRLVRLALGVEDSRSYWEHVDPSVPAQDRALVAFEQRWFGSKSLDRVRFLLANFVERYDAFPEALVALRRWGHMSAPTRQLVCHFHLQLSDAPVVLLYPGERSSQGLSFMCELSPDHDYRPRIYG